MYKWHQRLDVALARYSLKPGSTHIKLAPCCADKEGVILDVPPPHAVRPLV